MIHGKLVVALLLLSSFPTVFAWAQAARQPESLSVAEFSRLIAHFSSVIWGLVGQSITNEN